MDKLTQKFTDRLQQSIYSQKRYQIDSDMRFTTRCKTRGLYVGSGECQCCDYFVSKNKDFREVTCKYTDPTPIAPDSGW